MKNLSQMTTTELTRELERRASIEQDAQDAITSARAKVADSVKLSFPKNTDESMKVEFTSLVSKVREYFKTSHIPKKSAKSRAANCGTLLKFMYNGEPVIAKFGTIIKQHLGYANGENVINGKALAKMVELAKSDEVKPVEVPAGTALTKNAKFVEEAALASFRSHGS